MKFSLLLPALLLFFYPAFAQKSELPLTLQVLQDYDLYREPLIQTRLFKHADVVSLIRKHEASGLLKNEVIGTSVQGRSIHHLRLGSGKIKILMWSQMHGDEATATMALFDLLNFLSSDDKYNAFKAGLLSKFELHLVPMLNPDGAEIWTRTNAMKIDINRDAQNLATPEAKELMALAKNLKPDFGFNLHDQSTYYAAGKNTAKPASISFLAPAFNAAKDMNENRRRAIQVISTLNHAVQTQIPDQVAKYNDTFDGRCFGDTFQAMGVATILIETGGFPGDPDKQQLRKINFLALLTALTAIAERHYLNEEGDDYWRLPNNFNNLHDIILRDVNFVSEGRRVKKDIAINRQQRISQDLRTFDYVGQVVKMENLDSAFAYQDIDADSFTYEPGKVKMMSKSDWEQLTNEQSLQLLKQGFLYIRWTDGNSPAGPLKSKLINLTNAVNMGNSLTAGPANFLLTKEDRPYYAVVNGYMIDLSKAVQALPNVMGY